MTEQRVVFGAMGHPNVSARHRSTLEITREDYLTPRGDCIIAVSADMALVDFPSVVKDMVRDPSTRIDLILRVGDQVEYIIGRGDPGLSYSHPTDMVARKSTYTDKRTLMVEADKAACDLERELVEELRMGARVRVELVFKRPEPMR